jgi:Tfp pilus assembly protein PilN
MKAVNLVPESARRAGGSPLAAYVALGVLGVALLLVSVMTLTNRQLSDKQAELAATQAKAMQAEADAGKLKKYTEFSDLRAKRVETVKSLAESRFDWPTALQEIARALPSDASLGGMRGTVTPGVAVQGPTDPLRTALPVPAVELNGCAGSQDGVARVISSLRAVDGVQRVSLSSSEKGNGGDEDACSKGQPVFSMTVFFAAPKGAQAAGDAAAGGKATTASTTTTTTTTGASK